MRIKRKAAAGLCALMLAQTCLPAGAAQSRTAAVKESAEAESETIGREADSETAARITEEGTGEKAEEETKKKSEEKKNASVRQRLALDSETGRLEIEIELEGAEKGNILQADIPDGYEVKHVSRESDESEDQPLSAEADWQMEGRQLICQLDSSSSAAAKTSQITYRISCGFTDAQWEAYAKSREGLEQQITSQARLCDSEGVVLEKTEPEEKKLELKPFLEKTAEGLGRDERTFLWTDWMNLGMGAGEGYLVEVIEDLEDGQRFDFEENQVVLVDSDGEEIAEIPVSETAPEQPRAFGEIFTVEDARELAGGAGGAAFYTYEDDDEKQNGILLVPIDSLKEPAGVVYRTRVSASEQPDVYQWDVMLRSGSKFLWNRTGDVDEWEEDDGAEEKSDGAEDARAEEKSDAPAKAETGSHADHSEPPVWQLRAEHIPADAISALPEKTEFSSESVWLEASGTCSLVEQTAEEDAYDKESGTAVWDFFVNQNGENLQEVVITKEIPADEQSFTGDLADGETLEALLYEGEDWESDLGKKVEIPVFEEETFQKASEEEEGFFGYYVLNQDESGKSDSSLEIHLFQLGQAACEFQVETEVKDTVFAESAEEFAIPSGKTEYTAVLETLTDGASETKETAGRCDAKIPCENVWIDMEDDGAEEASRYDYEAHTIAWKMTVNPDRHSLLEPQATVTLPAGLDQVTLDQVIFIDEKGTKRDITEDEWIQVEETAPNKRKKERKAVFSWRAAEEEEETLSAKGAYQISFTCQVSDDMRKESFREQEPKEFTLFCELEGLAGSEKESRKLKGAERVFSCGWDAAAVDGSGSYQESRYQLEGSVWDGTQMPRADWCAVVNRNGAELADTVVRLTWPVGMEIDPDSVQVYTTKLKADGTEAGSGERKLHPELANKVQVTDSWMEFAIPEEFGEETFAITYSSFAASDMKEDDFKGTYQLMSKDTVLEAGELAAEGAKAVSVADAAKENQIPSVSITASSVNSDSRLPYLLNGAKYRLVKMTADENGDSWEDYSEDYSEAAEEDQEIEGEGEAGKSAEESEAVSGEDDDEVGKPAEESEAASDEDEEEAASGEDEKEAGESGEASEAAAEEADKPVAMEGTALSNGTTVFLFLEPDVLYRLEELEPTPGYEPWENVKYVAVLDQKKRSDFPKADDSHELITAKEQVLVKDARTPARWENQEETCIGGQIAFFVQDQEGQPLEGAECSLTYVDYTNPDSRALRSKKASSDENGLVVFDGLDAVEENREGYEIHVTAPSGMEDPAEFSASVSYLEDGTFAASLNGKAVEQNQDGAYVTCLPITADVQIPVTDQNGSLLKGCGLTLKVEVLTEENDETKAADGEEAADDKEATGETKAADDAEADEETEAADDAEADDETEAADDAEADEETKAANKANENNEIETKKSKSGGEKPGEKKTEKKKSEKEDTAYSYHAYEPCPEVSEDGSGYITVTDLPYGTYRLSGSTSVITLVIDDSGVEAMLEDVEQESEQKEGTSIELELEADSRGIYGAGEEDGWYLEEMAPRAAVAVILTDAANPEIPIEGGHFLVYETWSNRLIGELRSDEEAKEIQEEDAESLDDTEDIAESEEAESKEAKPEEAESEEAESEEAESEEAESEETKPEEAESKEAESEEAESEETKPEEAESKEAESEEAQPEEEENPADSEKTEMENTGIYRLIPSDREDAVKENDRGYEYIRKMDGTYRLLPGTYAIWQTESPEGYQAEGDGVWYFTIGSDSDEIGNDDLMAGDRTAKPFANSVIRAQIPVSTVWKGDTQADVTLLLKGTAWNTEDEDQEYEQKVSCPAGGSAVFEQVPVGIYVAGVLDEPESKAKDKTKGKSKKTQDTEIRMSSGKIQVQVQFDGQVIFRTISGRELEQAELILKEK